MFIASKPGVHRAVPAVLLLFLTLAVPGFSLDPHRSLSQYAIKTWTEEHGLPQDTIRAIAQTTDGYLWLGTDEGLARFDGYEFLVFDKIKGDLPGGSVTALAAARNAVLWIGTSSGLTHYQDKKVRTYTTTDGLPDNSVTELLVDHADVLWIVSGAYLSRFADGKFTRIVPGPEVPLPAIRHVTEDAQHVIWAGGLGAVVKLEGGKFITVLDNSALHGDFVTILMSDRAGNLWIGGSTGLLRRSPNGALRKFDSSDGLPDPLIRSLCQDRDGNIWVGTNAGPARLDGEHFTAARPGSGTDRGIVRCLFEDREGNLWLGSSAGLSRLRDTVFMVYGTPEGLPGDEPNTVFQDRDGQIWVGFHDSGLMRFSPGPPRVYTTRDGLPSNEIYSIRQTRDGDLLIGAARGMVRMHGDRFTTYVPPNPLARFSIYDALEDSEGRTWLATPAGLGELNGGRFRIVVHGDVPMLQNATVALATGTDGAIWAGTYAKGLWRVSGAEVRNFTTADGLSSDQIHALHATSDGTLWVGTFEGGLNAWRNGRFFHYTASDGLLSDNIADILDDSESLWLATTRGICRIPRVQLREFDEGKRTRLEPVNFGVEDGLRSAQCAPSYPVGGGGIRTSDGHMWFTTSRGFATYSPRQRSQATMAPVLPVSQVDVDGQPVDLSKPLKLSPGNSHIQIKYSAIYLSAPEQVQYSYKLSGLDKDWVHVGSRRIINYNNLSHSGYTFNVKAEVNGLSAERSFSFEVLPQFYESAWFRLLAAVTLAALAWAVYGLRLRQVRGRFALVLQERARLAREIHDTLAQGFVGISSQLDAVAMCLPDPTPARKHLDLARRMARHSLTEARRSVMDLRASALEGQNLAAALESGARQWTAGTGVEVDVQAASPGNPLPEEMEQHLLRIAQEAVTNVVKHAGATRIAIQLSAEARRLYLRIKDNGRGFAPDGAFSSVAGHFGVLGMRERAERLGGELRLESLPGEGTEVEVKVPLP